MKKIIILISMMVACLALAVSNTQATDDDGIVRSHRVSTVHKEVIELVTQADLDMWSEARAREKPVCEILTEGYVLCNGMIRNKHGYEFLSVSTIKEWSVSNNRELVDLSRYWQGVMVN